MVKRHRQYRKLFLHIVGPILCGVAIYIFYRGLYFIDPSENFFPLFSEANIPNWVKYNLPDGLWLYALIVAMFFIWEENYSWHFIAWLVFVIMISFVSEFLQAYGIILGTFDWLDLFAYSVAIFVFFINFYLINKVSFFKA